jgi:hypothetical protein
MPGAFAHDRMVSGAAAQEGQPTSFSDATVATPSSHAASSNSCTFDLFERAVPSQWTVIRGGTVLTMDGRSVLPKHDVLIRDRIIRAVQLTGQPLPDGAVIVEAEGRFVMPGFSNVHAHPFLKTWADAWKGSFLPDLDSSAVVLPYDLLMFQYLAAGVTRIEVMAGCADILAVRAAISADEIEGPRMQIGSPLIDGAPPIHSPLMSWIITDAEGGRKAARQILERGFDFAKPYSNLNREAYTALAEECRALGIRIMGHVTPHVGIEDAIMLGQGGIAHSAEYFYNETGNKRRDSAMFARYAALAAERNIWTQATVTVSGIMEVILGKRPLRAPDSDLMHPLMKKLFALDGDFAKMLQGNPEKAYLGDDTFSLSCEITAALRDAGAKILTGVDEPNPYLVEGFSLHEEFENLVHEVGMSPIAVLEATTTMAAEYHGENSNTGKIAPNMVADIVVLSGNPTQDISATRKIDTVLTRGTILRRSSIEKGMARIADRFRAMPI